MTNVLFWKKNDKCFKGKLINDSRINIIKIIALSQFIIVSLSLFTTLCMEPYQS